MGAQSQHRQRAVGGGDESAASRRVEQDAIGPLADLYRGDVGAALGVDHLGDIIVASRYQHARLLVESQSGGRVATVQRIGGDDLARRDIDDGDCILIFEINEDAACSVGGADLRLSVERDGADDALARHIHQRRVMALAIENDDQAGLWLDDDRIRLLSGRDCRLDFSGDLVEEQRIGGFAVGADGEGRSRNRRHAMNASAFHQNISDLSRGEVDRRDAVGPRDEKAVGFRVDGGEIPTAVGAGDASRDYVIVARRRGRRRGEQNR